MVDVDFFDTLYYQEKCKNESNVESSLSESINHEDVHENSIKKGTPPTIVLDQSDDEVDSGIDCPDELDLEVSYFHIYRNSVN